jgi:uncharacterized RmlC-like cupin family protein
MKKSCVVREADVAPYHPANHTGTANRRLIGPETVGASQMEVLLGVIEKNQGAMPHAHPGIEQAGYMLAGRARVEIGEGAGIEVTDVGPGDCIFFPADIKHRFTVTSDEPVRLLVMYAPPYLEKPENVIR